MLGALYLGFFDIPGSPCSLLSRYALGDMGFFYQTRPLQHKPVCSTLLQGWCHRIFGPPKNVFRVEQIFYPPLENMIHSACCLIKLESGNFLSCLRGRGSAVSILMVLVPIKRSRAIRKKAKNLVMKDGVEAFTRLSKCCMMYYLLHIAQCHDVLQCATANSFPLDCPGAYSILFRGSRNGYSFHLDQKQL